MYACSLVTDRTLVALGSHLPQLRCVDICGANSVSGVICWSPVLMRLSEFFAMPMQLLQEFCKEVLHQGTCFC